MTWKDGRITSYVIGNKNEAKTTIVVNGVEKKIKLKRAKGNAFYSYRETL